MITIVPMEKKHISQVHKIEIESFATPWSKKSIEKELKSNEYAYYFVAVDLPGEIVAGYGGLWHIINEGHITNIAVKPEYRRQGVATMIVEGMCGFADEKQMIGVTLEVRITNNAAISLYKKLGFEPEGIRKEYYNDTKEDALIMWKYLISKELIK